MATILSAGQFRQAVRRTVCSICSSRKKEALGPGDASSCAVDDLFRNIVMAERHAIKEAQRATIWLNDAQEMTFETR
jgi:hypothetical protein